MKPTFFGICLVILLASVVIPVTAQKTSSGTGSLHGQVTDPTGAVISTATVTVSTASGKTVATAATSGIGAYQIHGLAPGMYTVVITADGFAPSLREGVAIAPGQVRQMNAALAIQAQQQKVQVNAESSAIDTTPDSNANAVVIKGKDLDALSDDPDELQNELQALAGPSAGPNGAQIFIDGFTGGQMPPKSSIREIRINQNPFSAEFDRIGYGRIEIFTKPGTDKLHGHIFSRGNYSGFNAQNPILNANLPSGTAPIQEPSYYSYFLYGNVGGPITKMSSYFFNVFHRNEQNVNVIDAVDPASITPANPNGTIFNQTIGNPSSRLDLGPRLDVQLGQSNTLTLRYSFYRAVNSNEGPGETSLASQAFNTHNEENTLQASDSLVLSKNFVNDIRFRYRRIRDAQQPQFTSPTVTVQGAFTSGGSNSGTAQDNVDNYEIQDYFTGSLGKHSLNFGTRYRINRDANFTNAGTNGMYVFTSTASYLNRAPQLYQVTVVNNNQYTARTVVYDGAFFYQDDWRISPRFTFSYGTRWETQNYIHDKSDWAPRVYLAYALDGSKTKKSKTVLRVGYGWFYERFGTGGGGSAGTQYLNQTIHNNLPSSPSGVSNQQIYIINNPPYSETSPGNATKPPLSNATASAPTFYTLNPNFHAALDMQGAIGIDRQLAKNITSNITYLYSRGVHQYLTNNINAPFFDSSTNEYPDTPLSPPTSNIYQFQSGGVYHEDQIIASVNARYKRFSIASFYTYSNAKGDTTGVNHFPSNASNPGADYGRTTFDIQNRFVLVGSFILPYQFTISPFFAYQSGMPYNINIGNDLTANNQFNARPTFASSCSEAGVVATKYGCLNPNPTGTSEKIIPFGLGTGPSNVSLNLHVSKIIGFGPREGGHAHNWHPHSSGLNGRGLSGNQASFGPAGTAPPRKYTLTLSAYAANLLNRQNLNPPNGTLSSQLFGKYQSLAGGFFSPSSAGNRSIFLQTSVNF